MTKLYSELETVFHEPNRLAIVSELSGTVTGVSFTELKSLCGLTDGNLSRHLAALEKAGVVVIEKTFVGSKPRTTVYLSDEGREAFLSYLSALESVLKRATEKTVKQRVAKQKSLRSRKLKPA